MLTDGVSAAPGGNRSTFRAHENRTNAPRGLRGPPTPSTWHPLRWVVVRQPCPLAITAPKGEGARPKHLDAKHPMPWAPGAADCAQRPHARRSARARCACTQQPQAKRGQAVATRALLPTATPYSARALLDDAGRLLEVLRGGWAGPATPSTSPASSSLSDWATTASKTARASISLKGR